MQTYSLTRQELGSLLQALDRQNDLKPSDILRRAWFGKSPPPSPEFLPQSILPPIVEKLMRSGERKGFSLHEISDLGQLLDFSTLSVTSMQNWVKRDFKPYFQCPGAGKKYSLNQTAMLLMIDDLKANLDFESIRGLFAILFPLPDEPKKCDEYANGITPLNLFAFYSGLYEDLNLLNAWDSLNGELLEQKVRERAARTASAMPALPERQRKAVRNILFVAVVSVQAAKLQSMARRYCQATLYMNKP
ncbi:DUF1836 domain-containing protein [Paenibacillus soyae]|uniref:DUF1836 domain-containing protein n=1 Tax=Paenibacillus soyae TaxID=2969249 RepID=A0A9X2S7V5_9BACL|nr:DUF1836 domain-containing protein [Paenibacillus soyae]MCR2803734.1 DUF1836 domain-containing protein [Paenibacillus soyae]